MWTFLSATRTEKTPKFNAEPPTSNSDSDLDVGRWTFSATQNRNDKAPLGMTSGCRTIDLRWPLWTQRLPYGRGQQAWLRCQAWRHSPPSDIPRTLFRSRCSISRARSENATAHELGQRIQVGGFTGVVRVDAEEGSDLIELVNATAEFWNPDRGRVAPRRWFKVARDGCLLYRLLRPTARGSEPTEGVAIRRKALRCDRAPGV